MMLLVPVIFTSFTIFCRAGNMLVLAAQWITISIPATASKRELKSKISPSCHWIVNPAKSGSVKEEFERLRPWIVPSEEKVFASSLPNNPVTPVIKIFIVDFCGAYFPLSNYNPPWVAATNSERLDKCISFSDTIGSATPQSMPKAGSDQSTPPSEALW